jgi:hypothetical protein
MKQITAKLKMIITTILPLNNTMDLMGYRINIKLCRAMPTFIQVDKANKMPGTITVIIW